ncbi:uncharacterized protein Dwil_GK15793 [Drosophila willistoni]|uniref:LRRCT domain-containing protein n=1 Tax=Drosophila willistoni TaxID=7260 RepID=B4MRB6_DROWI|nr:immunoglobulin superfamily containing leucine-rich repeat protein 2 [Drosophila willistoni]XP_023030790.1 immunoglobulin superfamily containing leucine-rich repeat protein 2 [Drosophila willistoni]EDW74655.1 uncharacterized protein Dwil_GK15793 [Drosophila willistoni]
MELPWIVLIIVSLYSLNAMLAFGFLTNEERKCKYARIEKLLRIRCYDMDLKEVPQNLKTSVEVLDLSYNRIRKLKSGSFSKYTDVKFLMLYENMILSVEPGTFAPLTSLQEVDLSNNGLTTIPMELFQLPRLRNLYIDSNELRSLDLELLEKPIQAPLEYLNVANCELQDIPDLGILPKLWQLNASMNPLHNFNIDRLANFCHLSVIDLTRTQLSSCSCQQVGNHLVMMQAHQKFVPICMEKLDSSVCPLPYNRTIDSETFHSCQTSVELAEARSLWLFGAGCFGGVIFVLLVVWYCVHRWRKKRAKRRRLSQVQDRKKFVISPRNAINRTKTDDEPLHCDIARP